MAAGVRIFTGAALAVATFIVAASLGRMPGGVLVTHFEDGTPYQYLPGEAPATNIGWLDAEYEYPQGIVTPGFVKALSALCRDGVLRTRGWHYCTLCLPDQTKLSFPDLQGTAVQDERGEYFVGDSEIRVPRRGALPFAAPNMIIHYVAVHGYRPPDEFVDAVLGST